jgi:raffinose/stachyose/melibiose transport system permease protein
MRTVSAPSGLRQAGARTERPRDATGGAHRAPLGRSLLWGRGTSRRALGLLLALLWLVFAAAPIYYMLVVSFEPQSSYLNSNPWFPTAGVTAANYSAVFASGFGRYLLNSVITTLGTTVLAVTVSLLAAHVIVRRTRGITAIIFRVFLVGLAVPIQALIIPLYVEILRLHLYNTLFALIIPLAAFAIPLTVLILVNFLRDVPRELIDAVQIDGAGPVRQLTSLVIPVAKPAITTVAIYDALTAWNNFLFPLIFTQSSNVAVLPLAIFNFSGRYLIDIPAIMAAVFLSVAPLFVIYIGARRQIIGGLTAGFSR